MILSDGKPGHVNQSIAFARVLDCDYDLCRVGFRFPLFKALSYAADQLHWSSSALFDHDPLRGDYRAVVSAGSETYYANRVLAKKLRIKSVAIMLPQGYRYDFDLIVAQQHDQPPKREHIISLPVNLSYCEPQGLVSGNVHQGSVAVIIGGDSKHGPLEVETLASQIQRIFRLFPEHSFWLTTSRRTPAAVEEMLRQFSWTKAFFYSRERLNPVPDFICSSEYLFLTADSSSMISEAVSSGTAYVELLQTASDQLGSDKLRRMINYLQSIDAVHLFNSRPGCANRKIDLKCFFQGVSL